VRIAWDGRALVGPRTGIGWYTHHLIRGFESIEEDWTAGLYINQAIPDHFGERIHVKSLPFPNTVHLRPLWENLWLPAMLRKGPPDVWHSPLSVVPRKAPCATVATVHDVAFLHYPEILSPAYRKYWTRRIGQACQKADRVIAVSEATRKDLLEGFQADPARVSVVHEAADPLYSLPAEEGEKQEIRRRFDLPGGFFLFVGTLEPRKNLRFLFDVYGEVSRRWKEALPLVVAGGKGWLEPDIEKRIEAFGGKVRQAGYLERRDLRALYQTATLVLVPSLYEGFGLQAVEAMACGAVVMASNVSSLPEVVGEGGVLLSIESRDAWVDKIIELSDNERERELLSAKALSQAARFSWKRAAEETCQVYREAWKRHSA
jgi:glycosyltransferase involved in cell wall biosynthesis